MVNILFVENDVYWFQSIQANFMLQPNYKVEHATNMLEAMNILNSGNNYYNVIIISFSTIIQNSDSVQVIQNIKEKVPFAKIIFSLDNNDPYKYVSLMQGGADGVLIKPYSFDALISEIEKKSNSHSNIAPNQAQQNYISQRENNFNSDSVQIENLGEMGIPNSNINQQNPNNYFGEQNQQLRNREFSGNIPPNYYDSQQLQNHDFSGNTPSNYCDSPQQNYYHQSKQQQMNNNHFTNIKSGGVIRIPQNTTIAVHCPKGGVGKSSISKELATVYATSNVNGQPLKVCLIDMDIDYGDVAIMLELKQNKSIADWARNIRSRLGNVSENNISYSFEEIDKFYLLTHKSGLRVLAAPTNHRDSALINEQIVRIIINNLKKYFDIIIIDTGNNVKDFTVVSMEMADNILMICNIDVATISEILTLRKTLEQIQFPTQKIHLLMNEVQKNDEGHLTQISGFLGLPLIGVLPKTPMIADANNKGVVLSMGRDNPFTIGVKKVANTILPVVSKGQQPKNKKKKSIFSSLFSKK